MQAMCLLSLSGPQECCAYSEIAFLSNPMVKNYAVGSETVMKTTWNPFNDDENS